MRHPTTLIDPRWQRHGRLIAKILVIAGRRRGEDAETIRADLMALFTRHLADHPEDPWKQEAVMRMWESAVDEALARDWRRA